MKQIIVKTVIVRTRSFLVAVTSLPVLHNACSPSQVITQYSIFVRLPNAHEYRIPEVKDV